MCKSNYYFLNIKYLEFKNKFFLSLFYPKFCDYLI